MSKPTASITSTAVSPLTPHSIPTDPEDLIAFITEQQALIKSISASIDSAKSQLQALYELGIIQDKLSTPHGSASLTTRTTWVYSAAVKQLQDLEQLEGVATKKTSSSWTIRPLKDA